MITELDVGGAERALVALATGLDRSRWAPSVLSLGPPGPLVEPLEAAGVPTASLDLDPRRPISGVVRLARALRRHHPELVQSFLFHANLASRLAAPLTGAPWVIGGIRVAEREKRWHRALERGTEWLTAGSVCVSEGVYRFSVDVTRLHPERLVTIPNGIDPTPYDQPLPTARSELGVPEDALVILFLGRLTRQKGVDALLDAFRVVQRNNPSIHLVIVGDGPEADRLRNAYCPQEPGHDRIRWLGSRRDVPALLRMANVLALPSRWEGMPNVLLEAMAASRPVVATAVEGSRELVVPGQTGWLVPPEDAMGLAQALLDAASDRGRLERFGAAGRRRVEQSYSIAAVVSAYDRLWSAVLGYAEE